ncbi:MAG: hypothetical protein PWQ88_542 [Candidatus Methanomethylophilaceae archaeon]|nr:hypothetical protein [Candidatus Methanomethylophilaceae archaeon]MDI3541623.1 hypothetical protein [Candidatus Methanomethylophilaceae archaeon]
MRAHSYELRVKLDGEDMLLELYEMPPIGQQNKGRRGIKVSQVKESQLPMVQGAIARVLKNNKHAFSEVKRTRELPFKLNEEDGVRLELIFKAISSVKKRSKVEDIVLGIENMPREEAFYWHAKVTKGSDGSTSNGLKALRVLLGGD